MPNRTDNDSLKRLAIANPHWRIVRGEGFSTGEYFADVGAGNTKQVYVENQSSDIYFGIIGVNVRSSAETRVGKAYNPTEDTQGALTTTGITNKRSSMDGTNGVARTGGDNETGVYSGGDEFNDKGAGAGTGAGNIMPGETGEQFMNVVDPGDSIVVEAANQTTGTISYISIDIDWVEIPAEQFP